MEASSAKRTLRSVMNDIGRRSGHHTSERTYSTVTTPTASLDRANRPNRPWTQSAGSISGELYKYHGFNVFDADGERVGVIDWIWTDRVTGEGHHIGLQLQWLRGKARAVPATGARVDLDLRMVRLPFTKDQLSQAPRFRIDRPLYSRDRRMIAAHFAGSRETRNSRLAPLAA
jgi:hypothetical protein